MSKEAKMRRTYARARLSLLERPNGYGLGLCWRSKTRLQGRNKGRVMILASLKIGTMQVAAHLLIIEVQRVI